MGKQIEDAPTTPTAPTRRVNAALSAVQDKHGAASCETAAVMEARQRRDKARAAWMKRRGLRCESIVSTDTDERKGS